MDDKILLDALVKQGLLTQEAAGRIASEAAVSKRSVEELMFERRLVSDVEVAKVKSALLRIPYKKVTPAEIDTELLKIIPAETARTYKVIPLSRTKDMLVIGMLNPMDQRAQEALRFIAKQQRINLGVYLLTPTDFEQIITKYSPFKNEVEAAVRSLNLKPSRNNPNDRLIELEEGVAVSEEAPVIRIVAAMLKQAVEANASDIHVEPQRTRLRVRFRIDGDLQQVNEMPAELHQPIVSRIKVLANLKIDEKRIPQDGRFRTVIFGKDIDFRVATFPTPTGEKVAIRVLDPSVGLRSLTDLGLMGPTLDIVKEGIDRPYGMVLITGPTGSGKSTTLYALMQILNKEDVNIVSLEDPVEYYIDGLNQSQVQPDIGYDFAAGLRQILRQDPDVIMVGEIRDTETASLAVHAALTGHIVLSTLHTNNAIGVIPRLVDMKVDSFLLPSSLNLMVAQRLMPKLCQQCKKAETPSDAVLEVMKKELELLPAKIRTKLDIGEGYKVYRSPGCAACKNKGISGRVALFEVLRMTPELADIINAGPSENKIFEEAKRQGMITLRQDGIAKALHGLLSIEAVLRETSEI